MQSPTLAARRAALVTKLIEDRNAAGLRGANLDAAGPARRQIVANGAAAVPGSGTAARFQQHSLAFQALVAGNASPALTVAALGKAAVSYEACTADPNPFNAGQSHLGLIESLVTALQDGPLRPADLDYCKLSDVQSALAKMKLTNPDHPVEQELFQRRITAIVQLERMQAFDETQGRKCALRENPIAYMDAAIALCDLRAGDPAVIALDLLKTVLRASRYYDVISMAPDELVLSLRQRCETLDLHAEAGHLLKEILRREAVRARPLGRRSTLVSIGNRHIHDLVSGKSFERIT